MASRDEQHNNPLTRRRLNGFQALPQLKRRRSRPEPAPRQAKAHEHLDLEREPSRPDQMAERPYHGEL